VSALLQQPLHDHLAGAQRVLLAGCGGGYDVFAAVPLLVELLDAGKEVVLANHSFCYLNALEGAQQHPSLPNLYAVPATAATERCYCPEAWLVRWVEETLDRSVPMWAFDKTGVAPLRSAYRFIVESFDIDAVLLFDGGVDALLRGDESALGTPAEDLASVAAVSAIDVPLKAIGCLALGAELRDGICHEQVFGRIAELTRCGGFLGAAALLAETRAGRCYREAVEYTFAHQAEQRQSHINRVVLSAMRGDYGSDGPHIWISPLLNMLWYFDLDAVAGSHLFLADLEGTVDIWELSARIEGIRKGLEIRERSSVPI